MMWNLAVHVVVLVHFLWIVFLVFGAVIGRNMVWVKWLHIAGLTFSIALQIFHWTCPLTILEHYLSRKSAESESYTGGFLTHYLNQLVYLDVPPRYIFIGTIVVVVLSLWAYRTTPSRLLNSRVG